MPSDLRAALRFAKGLRNFAARPLSLSTSREYLTSQLHEREAHFLEILRKAVVANPASPYNPLFQRAGIDYEDMVQTVGQVGVEGALRRLYEAGVWVTADEFKGHCSIQRDKLEIPARPNAFDNPITDPTLEVSSGGSRGHGRRLVIDLKAVANDAAYHLLFLESFGLLDRPLALYRPAPPGSAGIKKALHQIKGGQRTAAWFSQTRNSLTTRRLRYWLFVELMVWLTRLSGRRMPAPVYTPLEKASLVARWLAAQRRAGKPGVLDTTASAAVGVCLAAKEEKLDISGSFLRVGGEPFTPAKARIMQEMGCRAVAHYSMSEVGHVGIACADPVTLDDVHFLSDKMALIQPLAAQDGGRGGAFFLTSLLALGPRVMINVESGDSGVYEERDCACSFGALGFRGHVHTIRSYEKLTAGGMHFLGYRLIELLEEVLPRKFGGAPVHYQLVESEEDGITTVYLCIDPRVGPIDEAAVLTTIYQSLERFSPGHRMMADHWRDAQTVKILRRECYTTPSSKVNSLHILREPIRKSSGETK